MNYNNESLVSRLIRYPLPIIGVFMLIVGALMSFYTIPAESEGVVLRFGKHINTVPSGLHFKLPFGIDKVITVATQRQLKLEFGFATPGNTNPDQDSSEAIYEKSMVTGDLNAAKVEWIIQYRITDPQQYLFDVRDPGKTLRDLSESVMREIIGDRTVDEVITIGREDIEQSALARLGEFTKRYQLGVSINQVQLKNVDPPEPVRDSFNEVNRAQQDRENAINIANGEYNTVIPRARGEADQKISAAEGYRFQRINRASGDVSAFNQVLEKFLKAPEVTRERIYLETLGDVIPQAKQQIIVDDSIKQILPMLSATPNIANTANAATATEVRK